MAHDRITGSFVALITPFNGDGSIDWEGFRTLLRFQEEHGTRAVLIMGSTGEVSMLSPDERRAIIQRTVQHKSDRMQIFYGCTGNNTATTIELSYKRKRVASHRRSYHVGGATTASEHMPKSHQRHAEWTPSRILTWAGQTGPATRSLAEKIMQSRKHPEQGYRSCLGLLRLGKTYGSERLEAACGRALAIGARSYQSVKSILKTGLDRQALPDRKAQQTDQQQNIADHENIRGSDYYH
jgi:transposase